MTDLTERLEEVRHSRDTPGKREYIKVLIEVDTLDEAITALREQDWRKGAHIEGVIDELRTSQSLMEQCQRDNGKLRAHITELEERLEIDTLNPNRREHINQLLAKIEQYEQLCQSVLAYHEESDEEFCENFAKDLARIRDE